METKDERLYKEDFNFIRVLSATKAPRQPGSLAASLVYDLDISRDMTRSTDIAQIDQAGML